MKNKIIGISIAALIIAGVGFKYYQYKNPEKFEVQQSEVTTSATSGSATITVEGSAPTVTTNSGGSININVDKPIGNVVRKGVVEVGASGFNSFVVDIDSEKNWELVSKQFGASLAYEGFATTDDVWQGLKTYIGDIFAKGVAGRNVHFVISSGALKNKNTGKISETIRKKGYVVNEVTAEQEGKYSLKAALPKSYKGNSFVVDIGSGNTKISWYEPTGLQTIECLGAKYYQIPKTDQEAYVDIAAAMKKVPVHLKKYCFIIGGVPYSLSKEVGVPETERFVKLKSPDEYSAGDDVKKKSGINIYRAIYENSGSTFVFDRDANFTIGFLQTLN